jgi:hypothetical protein
LRTVRAAHEKRIDNAKNQFSKDSALQRKEGDMHLHITRQNLPSNGASILRMMAFLDETSLPEAKK